MYTAPSRPTASASWRGVAAVPRLMMSTTAPSEGATHTAQDTLSVYMGGGRCGVRGGVGWGFGGGAGGELGIQGEATSKGVSRVGVLHT